MNYKIIIPKKGKHVGEARIEGMEQNSNCSQILQEVALRFGPVSKTEKIDHFGEDNPVHDSVFLS
jgi:hypothetical protein